MKVIGAFLMSSLNTLDELRELGEAVLAQANIDEIRLDTYYPATLRRNINQAVHDRFGAPGLFWIGIDTMAFMAQNGLKITLADEKAGLDARMLGMDDDAAIEPLMWDYLQRNAQDFTGYMHGAISGMPSHWGWFMKRNGPYDYCLENVSVGRPTLEAFGRGLIQWILRRTLPEAFDFTLEFDAAQFERIDNESVFRYPLRLRRKAMLPAHSELLARDQMAARDALLKFALRKTIEQEQRMEKALQEIEASHQLILESIRYASLLQAAQLPKPERWQGRFRDFAVLFQPRDVIGGDLWWISPRDAGGPPQLVVADCTGHGVPGAMLATLMSSALERKHVAAPLASPSELVDAMQEALDQSFGGAGGTGNHGQVSDGCDAISLVIRPDAIAVTGAGIGLMRVRPGQPVERMNFGRKGLSVGAKQGQDLVVQQLEVRAGDRLLIYTDGYCDQPGGAEAPRSVGHRRIAAWLDELRSTEAEPLLEALMQRLASWQGERQRRDDVTLLCIDL